ncbi:MAG: substrate-binding domain-containing protein [Alphaproteobacteria bacterium]|jgi:phosphate transport system substrate-binding protein|nr:substrate-binding domain-containing protein [Alphaproteobacteria bacterium]|tara:strand:+ start:752 stop:1786 length:1035 start_codon:yes stop_codon:yes gene_type:complete
MKKLIILCAIVFMFSFTSHARNQISVVGSSTVYPFSTVVAENFGRDTGMKTPKIESTGSGGGMKLFCAGLGVNHPDITNSSRRIKKSELEKCSKAGIEVVEIKVGYDGIVIANSKKGEKFNLSKRDIFLALAKDVPEGNAEGGKLIPNPNKTWKEVNSNLPDIKIEVLGPPPTSGTRDAFNELAIEGGCKTFPNLKAIKKEDKKKYKAICRAVREDGVYIEAGENDNLIVQKLAENKNALGVFGFSFLAENEDKIQGSNIDGNEPTFENIASKAYPVSRPLYFYIKTAHVDVIPGIREFVEAYTSDDAFGPDGYLSERGLIPMPDEEREFFRKSGQEMIILDKL